MTGTGDSASELRRFLYLAIGTVAVAIAVARVVGVENVYEPSRYRPPTPTSYGADRDSLEVPDRNWPTTRPEPTPMFGSNDRSRWATVRALVDQGTYVVGKRTNFTSKVTPWQDSGIIFEDGYQSLDKVMNPDTGEFYSSKPPLLPTLVAGEYWLLKHGLGWDLVHDRWLVVCVVLLTINVLPFAFFLRWLARLVEDYGETDAGKIFTFTAGCFATFIITFSVTLNNHLPALFCVAFAISPLLRKRPDGVTLSDADCLVSGFFSGLAATMDLPAAAVGGAIGFALILARPRWGILFVFAYILPVLALFSCNYAALGRFLPAYSEFGGVWYNFPGSHWAKLHDPTAIKKGIDFADESKPVYAFHLLLGHHGWFSLTPIWLIALGTLIRSTRDKARYWRRWLSPLTPLTTLSGIATITTVISIVLVSFYVIRTNNYGGFTSAPRWLIWLTPLWLVALLPAADRLARLRVGRVTMIVALGISTVSVFYPAWNPWRAPWLLQAGERSGWVRYGP